MNYFECCHYCVPPKRYPGCSGTCPEYKAGKEKLDADKARYNKERALRYYTYERSTEVKDAMAKHDVRRKNIRRGRRK